MKTLKILLIFLISSASTLYAQKTTLFEVTPDAPAPGDDVTLHFNASQGPLKGEEEIQARVYSFRDFQWFAEDVQLQKEEGDQWLAQYHLQPETSFIACVFVSDTLVDNGQKAAHGWIIQKMPGAYTGWGISRSHMFKDEVPAITEDEYRIGDDVALMWINNELRDFPQAREDVFYYGLKLMTKVKQGDHPTRIKQEVKYILSLELNNRQQYDLQRTLQLLPLDNEKEFIDSVEQVLLKKYPEGVLARDNEILRLFREPDTKQVLKGYKKFEKRFPQENFEDVYTDTEQMYYDKMYKRVAYTYIIEKKDYDFAFERLKTAPYMIVLDYSWHLISIPLHSESMSNDSLKLLADKIVPELERREAQVAKMYKGKLTPNQWKETAISYASREYLSYAEILEKSGEHEKSDAYLEKLKPIFGFTEAEFNALNANMLLRKEKKEEAISYIKSSLKENKATPAMIEILKKDFLSEGGKESEFDGYLASVKAGEQMEAQREEVLAKLMNEPISGFNLKNLDGEQVKLEDQKGNVVILDFWATWCAPCKKAMPGMQMAVNKYADDENVEFFFIDTQEFSSNFEAKVREFIEEKGYTFNVLFDSENEETHKKDKVFSTYAEAFKFSGIPQKLIIDQNGNLRWRSTGYGGSPSELADEISLVIEYLKQEQTR